MGDELPRADEVNRLPELLDCLNALRENAVTHCNYPVAVMWRDMREVVAEYNDLDAFEAKECTKALAQNLRLVASILERIAQLTRKPSTP